MKPYPLFVKAVARTVVLAMTAFTLMVAVRVLGEPHRSPPVRFVELVAAEEMDTDLPPGHPPIDGCVRLPPGHPPVEEQPLPPGHPPVGRQRLPAGHPPVDSGARPFPLFPQDGTSTL
jgi:hypothetical protein